MDIPDLNLILAKLENEPEPTIEEKIQRLVHNIINLKSDIDLFCKKKRNVLDENCEISKNLLEEARNLDKMIMNSIPVLEKDLKCHMELVEQYLDRKKKKQSEMKKCLNLVLCLTTLNVDMEKYKHLMSEKSIPEAYVLLRRMESFVENMKNAEFENIDIFDSFQTFMIDEKDKIIKIVLDYFSETIDFCTKTRNETNRTEIEVIFSYDDHDTFVEYFKVHFKLRGDIKLSKFDNLMLYFGDEILEKMFKHDYEIQVGDKSLTLTIDESKKYSNFEQVFENLKVVLRFMQKQFSELLFGKIFPFSVFEEKFIKFFLAHLVPFDKHEFLALKETLKSLLVSFSDCLRHEMHFDTNTSEALLINLPKNIDLFYLEKVVSEVLYEIKACIRKDLLQTLTPVRDVDMFSTFQVSTSFCDFIEKFDFLINELASFNYSFLDKTIEEVLIMVLDVVPKINQRLIENIPKQIALFFNNFQYLNAKLMIALIEKNKENSKSENQELKLLIKQFKVKAEDHFDQFVRKQNNQIVSILNQSGLNELKIDNNSEKLIRQCIRQFELLQQSWYQVLPDEIFFETFGTMIGQFFQKLIEVVFNVEDIAATNAEQIVDLYKIVIMRSIKLFPKDDDIEKYVRNWTKLNSLVFILKANLISIENQLSNGHNSLLTIFTPDELRSLIRALFQNTSRRADILAKIR